VTYILFSTFAVNVNNDRRVIRCTIRYDRKFNVDSKAEYSALSSTRSQKKKLKQTTPVPLLIQHRLRSVKSCKCRPKTRYIARFPCNSTAFLLLWRPRALDSSACIVYNALLSPSYLIAYRIWKTLNET